MSDKDKELGYKNPILHITRNICLVEFWYSNKATWNSTRILVQVVLHVFSSLDWSFQMSMFLWERSNASVTELKPQHYNSVTANLFSFNVLRPSFYWTYDCSIFNAFQFNCV